MTKITIDINGPGVAVQSYQSKVQELTDVIVPHSGRFHRIALRLLGNNANADDASRTLSCQPSHKFDAATCPPDATEYPDHFRGQANVSTLAQGHRSRCRSHEVASTFTASANLSRRNTRTTKPSARRNAARPPTKPPKRYCCRREVGERLADATTQLSPLLFKTFQTSGPGWLEH